MTLLLSAVQIATTWIQQTSLKEGSVMEKLAE
jgi:hypothetical protein